MKIAPTAMTAVAMILAAGLVFASGQDRTLTEEDFEEERVYSPYAGRAYADNVFSVICISIPSYPSMQA